MIRSIVSTHSFLFTNDSFEIYHFLSLRASYFSISILNTTSVPILPVFLYVNCNLCLRTSPREPCSTALCIPGALRSPLQAGSRPMVITTDASQRKLEFAAVAGGGNDGGGGGNGIGGHTAQKRPRTQAPVPPALTAGDMVDLSQSPKQKAQSPQPPPPPPPLSMSAESLNATPPPPRLSTSRSSGSPPSAAAAPTVHASATAVGGGRDAHSFRGAQSDHVNKRPVAHFATAASYSMHPSSSPQLAPPRPSGVTESNGSYQQPDGPRAPPAAVEKGVVGCTGTAAVTLATTTKTTTTAGGLSLEMKVFIEHALIPSLSHFLRYRGAWLVPLHKHDTCAFWWMQSIHVSVLCLCRFSHITGRLLGL